MASGFDEYRSHYLGVQCADIIRTARKIATGVNEADDSLVSHIGANLNEWQRSITEYGDNLTTWEGRLKGNPFVGNIDFGRREWARARNTVDAVMAMLLQEMRYNAEEYSSLRIDSYIRQGSSRDGLKVLAPDEFDTVIEFHIDGLQFREIDIYKHNKVIPGYCYIEVDHSEDILKQRYTALWKEDVFEISDKKIYLCSKTLHRTVLMSIVDKSCNNIQDKIDETKKCDNVNFSLTRRMNPPAINLTICLNDKENDPVKNKTDDVKVINLDIVPAFRLRYDNTTLYQGQLLNCPIHAVCKWREDEHKKAFDFARSDIIWHINTSGYEKHALDVARGIQRQKCILTALRVVKTFFANSKKSSKTPPQIVTVLKSYHLKQIAFYVILHLCFLYPHVAINGVCDALRYLLGFLRESLEKKHLPHFFYCNAKIHKMFPNFPTRSNALRFDLFRKISSDSLVQALLSLNHHIYPELGYGSIGRADPDYDKVMESFSSEISSYGYF